MTEEVPAAPTMPTCNGSVPPEDGPLQAIAVIDEIPKSLGMVPYPNADMSSDVPPAKENLENRNSLAEDITPGGFAGEKRCQEKREEKDGPLQQGPAAIQDTGTDGQGSGEGPGDTAGPSGDTARPSGDTAGPSGDIAKPGDTAGPSGDTAGPSGDTAGPSGDTAGPSGDTAELGTAARPGGDAAESSAATAAPPGNAAREDAEEEEEEDTEEDEVQVIEIKKSSEVTRPQPRDSGKEPPGPAAPAGNSPLEKPGELPSLGKKNDISRHSYSRYNTISYRRIRKGNTKQRIDEFESMMHL